MPQQRSGVGTRPTTDRVRESLFNILDARIAFDGVAVLDLFAGSGALGLEALSRGAASALFVESDRTAAAVIADNVRTLGASGAEIRCATVESVLNVGGRRPVGLVFADPPYEVPVEEVDAIVATLSGGGWLADGAVVVVERAAAGPAVTWPSGWDVWRERRYGDTRLEMARYGD